MFFYEVRRDHFEITQMKNLEKLFKLEVID